MNSLGILVFDMDGTLVDSMKQHAESFSRILYEEFAIPQSVSRQQYFKTAGQPLDEQFRQVLRSSSSFRAADLRRLIQRFWELVQVADPILFPEVAQAIEQLWQAGYVLNVVSGCAPDVVASKMCRTGIDRFFASMLGTDRSIPNMIKGEGHFMIIRHELDLTPTQFRTHSVLVGDAEHDMLLAKEAGIVAIGRTSHCSGEQLKEAGADFVVSDLMELVTVLQRPATHSDRFLPVCQLSKEDARLCRTRSDQLVGVRQQRMR